MAEIFPQEILSRIVRFCIEDSFSLSVVEKIDDENTVAGKNKRSRKIIVVASGIPDVSNIRLVNQFFDEEARSCLTRSYDGRLELIAQKNECFSAKAAKSLHPRYGQLAWILPLVRQLRISLCGIGPAAVALIDSMKHLQQITAFRSTIYGNERMAFNRSNEDEVKLGRLDQVAIERVRDLIDDTSKATHNGIERLQARSISLLVELEYYEHLNGNAMNWRNGPYHHIPFDVTFTIDISKAKEFHVVDRVTSPFRSQEID